MRTLLLSLALALAAAALPGPSAPPSVGPSSAAALGLGNDLGTTDVMKKKKKKKDEPADSGGRSMVKMDEIEPVKLGKTNLEIHAAVEGRGITCTLGVTYNDGKTEIPPAVVSDENRNCVLRITVPTRKEAAGTAAATVTAVENGVSIGWRTRTFKVK